MSAANLLRTAVKRPARAFTTSSTDAAYTDPVATTTEPTGAGIIDIAGAYGQTEDNIFLMPFGAGSATQIFNLRVHGWCQTANGLWVPFTLLEVACTLGSAVGVAAADVLDTENFCDAATGIYGTSGVEFILFAPGSNLFGGFIFDQMGFRKFQLEVKVDTATAGNALWRGL